MVLLDEHVLHLVTGWNWVLLLSKLTCYGLYHANSYSGLLIRYYCSDVCT